MERTNEVRQGPYENYYYDRFGSVQINPLNRLICRATYYIRKACYRVRGWFRCKSNKISRQCGRGSARGTVKSTETENTIGSALETSSSHSKLDNISKGSKTQNEGNPKVRKTRGTQVIEPTANGLKTNTASWESKTDSNVTSSKTEPIKAKKKRVDGK